MAEVGTWGAPSVGMFPKWQGGMSVDFKMDSDSDVYAITGIDRDEWTIIGFEWRASDRQWGDVNAIVVPSEVRISESPTRIEATALRLHDVSITEILPKIVHKGDFRMRRSHLANSEITITSLGDVPEQD